MTENWLGGRNKGWLKDYVSPRNEPAKPDQENGNEGVIFIRAKCPKCGNKEKLICYRSEGGLRYYKCSCGEKFKAVEKDFVP